VPIGANRNTSVKEAADRLHAELEALGIEVLYDDRDERPGVMFADMELIGIPHRLVIGDRGLKEGKAEYKGRADEEPTMINLTDAVAFIRDRLCA
jgi:prolyl-tRNA synthetase